MDGLAGPLGLPPPHSLGNLLERRLQHGRGEDLLEQDFQDFPFNGLLGEQGGILTDSGAPALPDRAPVVVVPPTAPPRYCFFPRRLRSAYAATFERFPQICMLHQRRVPFLLVS